MWPRRQTRLCPWSEKTYDQVLRVPEQMPSRYNYCYVRPCVEYSSSVWSAHSESHVIQLVMIQWKLLFLWWTITPEPEDSIWHPLVKVTVTKSRNISWKLHISCLYFQWVCGFMAFLFPKLGMVSRTLYMPQHVFWGLTVFGLACATALMGITEKAFILMLAADLWVPEMNTVVHEY